MPLTREPLFIRSLRPPYRAAAAVLRHTRGAGNRLLNAMDPPAIILLYHRVNDLAADPEKLAVSPQNFRRQMEFLRERFAILRFEDDWSGRKEPAVGITFDDGYADNLHEALPILEEVGVPATFFISTGLIGTGETFWWHRLEAILLGAGNFPPRFVLEDSRYGRSWDTDSLEQRRYLYGWLNKRMQRIGPDRREAWLDQLETWSDRSRKDREIHRSMTREEVKRLAESPWATVGAHTVTHSALSALPEEQQRREILSSKESLEMMTGTEVTTFSYPFGRKQDYDRTSVRLCREAGFIRVASNFPGQVHRWSDPYQVPRHLVRNWDLDTFARELGKFWTR